MKDAYKRKIRRLEEELMVKSKEFELLKIQAETESAKLAVAEAEFAMESHLLVKSREAQERLEARHTTVLARAREVQEDRDQQVADAEDARSERDGVQTENEELRQTLSNAREDWRRERSTLEFRASEAETQLHSARQSGHQRLGG